MGKVQFASWLQVDGTQLRYTLVARLPRFDVCELFTVDAHGIVDGPMVSESRSCAVKLSLWLCKSVCSNRTGSDSIVDFALALVHMYAQLMLNGMPYYFVVFDGVAGVCALVWFFPTCSTLVL